MKSALRQGATDPDGQVGEARGLAALDALAPEWLDLCRASPNDEPYFHPGWIRAQVCAFESPHRLILFTVRQARELTAVLPLIAERAWFRGLPARRLRSASHTNYSVRFDLVAAAGAAGAQATAALARHFLARRGWDVIELADVPEGGAAHAWMEQLQSQGCATGRWEALQAPYIEPSPTPVLGPDGKPLAAGMEATRADFRAELRRTRRQLEATAAQPTAQLRLVEAAVSTRPELHNALQEFYQLESAGWKGAQGSAILSQPRSREFFDRAAEAMCDEGLLVVHRLELEGRTMAMSYSLRHTDCYQVVKWCYDEKFSRFGPGHLLIEAIVAQSFRAASGPPLRRIAINGPDAAYKRKWTQSRLRQEYLYAFAPGLRGAMLHGLKFRLVPWFHRVQSGLFRRSAHDAGPRSRR